MLNTCFPSGSLELWYMAPGRRCLCGQPPTKTSGAVSNDLSWLATSQAYPNNSLLGELSTSYASLVAQMIKRLPAMQETRVQSLGWEDPLEKEMATLSSILAWRIPWTEEPGRLQSTGSQRVGHNWATFTFTMWFHQEATLETCSWSPLDSALCVFSLGWFCFVSFCCKKL